jgi:hypothetical protein
VAMVEWAMVFMDNSLSCSCAVEEIACRRGENRECAGRRWIGFPVVCVSLFSG